MTTTGSPRPGADTVAALTIDVDAHSPVLARSRRYAAHTGTMSHQQYGVDVGVPRLLRLLAEEAVPATFFVPGWVAEHHPGLTAAILEHGHEIAHHTYAHRPPVEMSDDEQRADFTRALEVFAAQDVPVEGFRAANWQPNETTCRLVAEHGLYDSSLMGHDRPYRVTTADGGGFVELPPHWSLDDWEQYAFLPDPHVGSVIQAPHTVLAMWRDELDAHAQHEALFLLTLHPELTGRPARAEALRSLLAYARGRGTRFARCADIARAAAADPHLTTHSTAPPAADAYPA